MLNNTRAFTLIELLMAGGMLMVIIAATALMLTSSRRSYLSTDAALTVQNQAALAFDIMGKELAAAFQDSITTKTSLCANCAIDFMLPLGTIQNGVPNRGAVDQNRQPRSGWQVEYRLEALPDGTRQLIRILQDTPGHDAAGEIKRVITNNVDPNVTDIFQLITAAVKIRLQITAPVPTSILTDTRTTNLLRTQVQVHN